MALAGCGQVQPPAPSLSDPVAIYTPGTDGIDTQFVGFTGHAGTQMLVVSINQAAGNFGYAMRIDANGNPVDIARIGAPDWPKQLYSNMPVLLALTESANGFAIVQADHTNWIDASGAVTSSPSNIGTNLFIAGLAPSATGVTAFTASSCTGGASLTKFDLTPTSESSTPVTGCETFGAQGVAYAVAFDAQHGGAAMRIALPTAAEITPLDAQGAPAGAAATFTSNLPVVPAYAPLAVTSTSGAAFVLDSSVVTSSGGTIVQSTSFPGPITGLVASGSTYALSYDVTMTTGPCKQFGSCLVQLDAAANVVSSALLDAHDGTYVDANMHLCSHPILAPDGNGSGKLLALCSDGGGLIARTASMTDPSPKWVDSWRLPGSISGLEVFGSPSGALVQIIPHFRGGPPDVVPLDATGAAKPVVVGSPRILAASASGFLASSDTQLVFLDPSGAQIGAIDTPATPIAATSLGDTGLVVSRAYGPEKTTISRFDSTGATSAVASTSDFIPDALCPADPMGTVLAYGFSGVRRISSGGEWVDTVTVPAPKSPLSMPPYADCWSCGPNCWLLAYRGGGVFRLEGSVNGIATTTLVSASGTVETAGAGDTDRGVIATLDASSSSIVLQRLTGLGDPDGAPFTIPTTQDVIDGDTNVMRGNGRRIGVGMLDPTHYVVAYVASDGKRETVARRVVTF